MPQKAKCPRVCSCSWAIWPHLLLLTREVHGHQLYVREDNIATVIKTIWKSSMSYTVLYITTRHINANKQVQGTQASPLLTTLILWKKQHRTWLQSKADEVVQSIEHSVLRAYHQLFIEQQLVCSRPTQGLTKLRCQWLVQINSRKGDNPTDTVKQWWS